jgi:(p)ppGpp synthase/HD superfamily hydrolase
MVYTPLTYKAMNLAYNAHHGQMDKSGAPYIFHPIHLAEQMDDETSCCAALLHDVVEDTEVTLDDLRKDFPEEVVEAVRLLTHGEGVPDVEYLTAIKGNPIALKVKLADNAHNADQTRCCNGLTPKDKLARWQAKYARAREILLSE